MVRRASTVDPDAPRLRAKDAFRTRARANVYLKDPLALSRRKGAFPIGEATVGGDTSIAPGPTSSRFMVVDYDASTDRAFAPARPNKRPIVQWTGGRGELLFDFRARPDTRGEAQVNAWATAVDTLDLFEQPAVLGREVPWAFEGSRLRILPQAMYEANAFYDRRTRALHFGYFDDAQGGTIKTALSHDIVSHETAHAILDGLRPYYLESIHPDAAAFHEYVGDVAAMLSLFRQRDFIRQLAVLPFGKRRFFDLVTDLAPQVAVGLYGDADRAALRTATNRLTYRDVADEPEPHRRSQVLSGLAFQLFEGVLKKRIADAKRGQPMNAGILFRQLMTTARHVLRMLLRPIDLLPPGEVTFPEYAAIVLRSDRYFHPADRLGYRDLLEGAMKQRRVHPSQHGSVPEVDQPDNRKLRERDIEMIRGSRVGAYRFLDANRSVFAIPATRDFRVAGIGTNRRELELGTRAVPETIVQYVWEERVPLPHDAASTGLDHLLLRAGGTIAIDESANLVHWSPQPATAERRDALRERAARLIRDRAVDFAPVRHLRARRPFLAARDAHGEPRLFTNTAQLCARAS